MAMKDILLQLTAYPVRGPRHAIEHAMAIAQRFDTRITAAICKVDLPDTSNYLARAVTGIVAAVAGEREKFDRSAVELAAEFRAAAFRDGQTADAVVLHSIFRVGSRTARCADTVSSALTIITTASTASPPMARR